MTRIAPRCTLLATLLAAPLATMAGCEYTVVTGWVAADDARLGVWDVELDHCESGERYHYYGVELWSDDAPVAVRIVDDPVRGLSVVVLGPEDERIMTPARCDLFGVELEQTDTQINDIWAIDGELDLDCPTVDGWVAASVRFQGCA